MANLSGRHICRHCVLAFKNGQNTAGDPLGDVRECLGCDDRHVSLPSQDVSIVSGCSTTRVATGLTLGASEANAEISFYENLSLKLGQRDEASLVEDAPTFSNHGRLEGKRRQLPWMQWQTSRSGWRALALGITNPSAYQPISPELRTCGTHGMVMCWITPTSKSGKMYEMNAVDRLRSSAARLTGFIWRRFCLLCLRATFRRPARM